MANPVIDSVTPSGVITAPVGSQVVLTVTAHDDDTHATTATLVVNDSQGNPSQPATVTINWVDTLEVDCTVDDDTPVSVNGMTVVLG